MPPSEEFIQSVQAARCCCLARPMDIPPECPAPTFPTSRFCHCLLGWRCTCFQHSQSCKLSRSPNNLLFPSDLPALEPAYLCMNWGKCSSLPQVDFHLWSWDEHQILGSLFSFLCLDLGIHFLHCFLLGPSKCSLWRPSFPLQITQKDHLEGEMSLLWPTSMQIA